MVNWAEHKAHRAKIVADYGQWVGLLDENGVPLMDLPTVIELHAGRARASIEDMEFSFGVRPRHAAVHKAVAELVSPNLGTDGQGELVINAQPTRFVAVETAGGRTVYKCLPGEADGGADMIDTVTVKAVHIATLLETLPCWSAPLTITGQWRRLDRDFVKPWSRLRDVQSVELAAQADGFTVAGPALATIHRLIRESLDATWKAEGITDNPPIVVADTDLSVNSPEVLIRPTDDSIWDTVTDVAMMAGVTIAVDMWLPEDPPVPGHDLTAPTVVVTLDQEVV